MADTRSKRIANNESRFRDINESLRRDLAKLPGQPDAVPFVCECGLSSCAGTIEITVDEYEAIRANPRRFIVLAGHEIPDVEHVVTSTRVYTVVEKKPEVGPLVDATDPRHEPR